MWFAPDGSGLDPHRSGVLAVAASLLVTACGGRGIADAGPDGGDSGCPEAVDPLSYGQRALCEAMADAGSRASISVLTADMSSAQSALAAAGATLDPRPESFVILPGTTTVAVGRDAVGAMYAALELVERLEAGAFPPTSQVDEAPATPLRAANLFLVLPAPGESSWWFLSQDFWTEYLDLLARARFDFLDLHGMYSLANTGFPNALLYFGTSQSHPDVGVADRPNNLAMLSAITAAAAVRGIRVGLMSYGSDLSPGADGTSPWTLDAASEITYTREAVNDIASHAGLWRLGFRIGETVHPADWYVGTFIAGVQDANNGTLPYTRTWGVKKSDMLALADAGGPDMAVEAKYNGEQLGAPYPIAGGLMAGSWHIYSYEDYLSPPTPYQFVFQLRMGGTSRIFRQASYARAAHAAATFTFGVSRGFTLEPPHAYLPQEDFYHAVAADQFSPWAFRRDELTYLLYGRLSYDPTTPAAVFQQALSERVGTTGLWDAVQAASDIVPWIHLGRMCGPDQRFFAPELELGGSVGYWSLAPYAPTPAQGSPLASPYTCGTGYQGPFDTFAIASPYETASDLIHAVATVRVSSLDVAAIVLADAAAAREAAGATVDSTNAEARDVVRECVALADLGDYFGHKLRAATALAVYAQSASAAYLTSARSETQAADDAWTALAADTAYIAPFTEGMRMRPLGIDPFHWSKEVPWLPDDPASIDAVVAQVQAAPPSFNGTLPVAADWLSAARPSGPGLSALTFAPQDPNAAQWSVTATFAQPPPTGSSVAILWKPFSGLSDWSTLPADGGGSVYQADVPGGSDGALFATCVTPPSGTGWCYPDMRSGTPYVVLPPQ
jgi:hypothetical protein